MTPENRSIIKGPWLGEIGVPESIANKLKDLSILTPYQLATRAQQEDLLSKLRVYLGLSVEEMGGLLEIANSHLSPNELEGIRTFKPTRRPIGGARDPSSQ